MGNLLNRKTFMSSVFVSWESLQKQNTEKQSADKKALSVANNLCWRPKYFQLIVHVSQNSVINLIVHRDSYCKNFCFLIIKIYFLRIIRGD